MASGRTNGSIEFVTFDLFKKYAAVAKRATINEPNAMEPNDQVNERINAFNVGRAGGFLVPV
jgi:hypothetical protein